MVAIRAGAREVPVLKPGDVRFGSKADICSALAYVRFTPESDRKSGHPMVGSARPARADTLGRCAMPDKLRRGQRSSLSTDGGAPEIPDLLLKD